MTRAERGGLRGARCGTTIGADVAGAGRTAEALREATTGADGPPSTTRPAEISRPPAVVRILGGATMGGSSAATATRATSGERAGLQRLATASQTRCAMTGATSRNGAGPLRAPVTVRRTPGGLVTTCDGAAGGIRSGGANLSGSGGRTVIRTGRLRVAARTGSSAAARTAPGVQGTGRRLRLRHRRRTASRLPIPPPPQRPTPARLIGWTRR